eukprot:TRINITY_DN61131_c0_g1_i1.p1 TRINITY_DN61131_c0_g1~~TRINITY_DN61131_c0_g1_i1.p1  ORF type:complete len:314 (+),score=61.93 TRINITY_DN61131_c0_g1_i1:65-943(+)
MADTYAAPRRRPAPRDGGRSAVSRSRSAPACPPEPRLGLPGQPPPPPRAPQRRPPAAAARRSRSAPQPPPEAHARGPSRGPITSPRRSGAAPSVPTSAPRSAAQLSPRVTAARHRRAARLRATLISIVTELEYLDKTSGRDPRQYSRVDLGARALAQQLREADSAEAELIERLQAAHNEALQLREALRQKDEVVHSLRETVHEYGRVLHPTPAPPPTSPDRLSPAPQPQGTSSGSVWRVTHQVPPERVVPVPASAELRRQRMGVPPPESIRVLCGAYSAKQHSAPAAAAPPR